MQLVRNLYSAFNRGDIEPVVSTLDPEIEFRELESLPGAETYHGRDGFRRFVAKLADAFPNLRYEVQEMIPAGEQVVVVLEASGTGRESGVDVHVSFASLWALRDGRLVRHVAFDSRGDALEAAGLSE